MGNVLARIGPYRIERILGEGGMGTVYLAEQEQPVQRQVALKVVKRGMDSPQILARFELERRALALMNHSAIAKVFDAGTTPEGLPFLVMEYVSGESITDYCDRHGRSLRQRIELFEQVCAGVQHAHQKGVLHRDLKPANVLVVREGERDVVKIIDFGLARATDRELLSRSLMTEEGQLIGTPEYMSPEQAAGHDDVIDTRTDIYSLGVMLYELLSGELPFSVGDLRRAGVFEFLRVIQEDEPPKPSARVSSLGERASEFATARGTTPVGLRRSLRGDLDWIVLRAMAKEPDRRYASAFGLSSDLVRYLADEPVVAGPPGAGYRLSKFVRRYRLQVAAATVTFVTLVAAVIVSTRFAIEANAQAIEAGLAADGTTAIHDFLVKTMIESATPDGSMGAELTAKEVFLKAVSSVDEEFVDQPALAAIVRSTIADAFWKLRDRDRAIELLRPALEALAELRGPRHRDTLMTAHRLGSILLEVDDLDGAEPILRQTLQIRREDLGDDAPDTLRSRYSWATLNYNRGNFQRAAEEFEAVWRSRTKVLGAGHRLTLNALRNHASAVADTGDLPAAIEKFGQLVRLAEPMPDGEPMKGAIYNDFAINLDKAGRNQQALDTYQRTLELTAAAEGVESQEYGGTLNNRAVLRHNMGQLAEAKTDFVEALRLRVAFLGKKHSRVGTTHRNYGLLLSDLGEHDQALEHLRAGVEILDNTQGVISRSGVRAHAALGVGLGRSGDAEGAAREFAVALDNAATAWQGDHWEKGRVFELHGDFLAQENRIAEAIREYATAYRMLKNDLEIDDRRTQQVVAKLVRMHETLSDEESAAKWRTRLR